MMLIDLEYRNSIISYYDQTRLDYRILWFSKKSRSVHFGYYDHEVKSHDDALLNLNKVMASKSGVQDGDIILDAGCGQGASSLWLAKNFNVQVSGITLVPHQVKKAQKETLKNRMGNRVFFSEQDYTDTNFKDESFSLIWACESMCHARNKIDFYKEAYRLLKPGGRLVCADYFRTKRQLQQDGEKLLHEWLDSWSIIDIDDSLEHKENAEKCGFTDFQIENITEYTRPSLRHLHSMASKLWRFGQFLKKIGLRNNINHGNHLGSIKQFEALENELWYYGLLTLKKT